MKKQRATLGFTIVELLIVIVVIAILAAIAIAAYNGMQKRALNTARITELRQWVTLLELYKAHEGNYPRAGESGYTMACLGVGFPQGFDGQPRCREPAHTNPDFSVTEAEGAGLMADLAQYGRMPPANKKPAGDGAGFLVGPWIEFRPPAGAPYPGYGGGGVYITTAIDSNDPNDCPSSFTSPWGGNGARMCTMRLSYN